MNDITSDQLTMLETWQQHTQAEFVLKDVDAALATMTDDCYVLAIAGTGASGLSSRSRVLCIATGTGRAT